MLVRGPLERAVACCAIEKTVVEGAGAAGLAALLASRNVSGPEVGLVLSGGNIDTRLLASVLIRDLVRDHRLVSLRKIIGDDRPGLLATVSRVIGDMGANIIEVAHQRTFSALPAKATLLELVIETRDRAHLDDVMARLEAAGLTARCT